MSRPLTGTNLGTLAIYAQSSGPFNAVNVPLAIVPDDTGTYCFVTIRSWFSVTTTLSSGATAGDTVLNLTSVASWRTNGGYARVTTDAGTQMLVAFTGITGNQLTGCTGITAAAASGKAVIPAPCIAKIQLSNLTAVGSTAYYYPLLVTPQSAPFYDAASSLVLFVGSDNKLYSLPASGGASPWALTQVGAGALTPTMGSWGGLRYDPTIGIVWNANGNNTQRISGFYYKDPLAANADFTLAFHPMPYFYGTSYMTGNDAVAFTPGAARMVVVHSTVDGPDHVVRWRADQMRCDILTDGSGRTNGSADGTTTGTAVTNAKGAVYDPAGRLYVFAGGNMYPVDPTTEVVGSGIAMTGGTPLSAHVLPSGGWSGGGNDQLLYQGSNTADLYLSS